MVLTCWRHVKIFSWIAVLLAFSFTFFSISFAEEISAGKIVKIKGKVEIARGGGQAAEPAAVDQQLNVGDTILTGPDGTASILLSDESMVQINKNSRFVLQEVEPKAGWIKMKKVPINIKNIKNSVYNLEKGEAWIRNKDKGSSFQVKTPNAVAGVRGTDLDIKVEGDGVMTLTVMEGMVTAKNDLGSVDVAAGEQAVAKPGSAPVKKVLVSTEEAVQWTISIPPVLDLAKAPAALQSAVSELNAGNIRQAQELLSDVTAKHPDNSYAWGLLALTNVMTGKADQALKTANKGVDAAPDSATALVLQSYAYQAAFDIDSALDATKKAVKLDDKNVFALINLAKLQFATGYTDDALKTVEKARQLSPQDPEVQNLLGFILLSQRKTDSAVSAFKLAVKGDPGNGEAHMGLSLAYMRKGDTATAMEEISTAVLLEPRRSLFLSYWAKMLYQVKRFDQALDMLKFARQLDKNDPTPELYSAIIYRDLNQPTEAIESINRAMALNDKRAVYRSRFLLDQDSAVKSVNLSVLYEQLGLNDWSRNKALASVKQDYTNYSGHLFLGGALRNQEGRSLASQGEYLLARLLQPANLNTFNTFNEYTSFFEKPAVEGTISGTYGTHDTKGSDISVYGALPGINTAFNVVGLYTHTDGWRDTNNDQLNSIAGTIKWDVTSKDSFMLAILHSELKQTDRLFPRFEFESLSEPADLLKDKENKIELGYHHNFSPHSDLLLVFSRLEARQQKLENFHSTLLGATNNVIKDFYSQKPYYQVQGQQLFKTGNHQFIMGAVQYRGDTNVNGETNQSININGLILSSKSLKDLGLDRRFQSFYLQDIWNITPRLIVEAAAYFDRMSNGDEAPGTEWSIDRFNPRIGVAWRPTDADTFRFAAFRYLVPFVSSRIDPMDIAGVPVLRNTQEGSEGREFDIVWEHEWATGFLSTNFFNLKKEFFHKDVANNIERPVTDDGRFDGIEIALDQLLWRGYGLAAGYRYLDVDDKSLPTSNRQEHLATVGLKHLHKSGFSAGVFETYRFLDLKFPGRPNEGMWITDAQLGYEFPRKRGSITLNALNIFNNRFNWVTDQFIFSGRNPAREIIAKLSLNF